MVLQQSLQFSPWELVHDLGWSADGRWLAVAAGENVVLYDGASLESLHTLAVGTWASELAFAPQPVEGRTLLALAGRDGALQLWDVMAGTPWLKFQAHNKGANSLAFSSDGVWLASAGNDAILRLWETAAFSVGDEIAPATELIGGAAAVPAVRFSPGGLVASVDLQSIRLRDPQTDRLVRTLRGEASIFALAFSPDGASLAAAEEASSLRLWGAAGGEELLLLQAGESGSEAFMWDVAFCPDGSMLAAVNSAGEVFVWSYPGGELVVDFRAHNRGASALAFSPDGKWLATGGLDGVVQIWQTP